MKKNHQFRQMFLVSVMMHIALIVSVILIYFFRPPVELVSSSNEAQFVELYDIAELPDLPMQEIEQQFQEPPEQEFIAYQNISAIIRRPTPTPTPTLVPTPTPEVLPTPTPTVLPTPTPTPLPTPTRKPQPRRIPPPRREQMQPKNPVVATDVPKRKPVIQRTPATKDLKSALAKDQQLPPTSPSRTQQPGSGTGRRPGYLSTGPSVTLDQTDTFPYPEYLEYIEKKIAGLWFPQGSGTVSVYLIITRNGKILKSGVDKGEGLGVSKLRDSVVRAIAMIKHFDPLPQKYNGLVLRVQITVRR